MFYIYHDRQASGGKESVLTFGIPFMSHYLESTDMAAHSLLKCTRGKHQSHIIKSKTKKKRRKTAAEVRKAAEMTAHLADITAFPPSQRRDLHHRHKRFFIVKCTGQ